MHLVERLWASVTSIISIGSLSPLQNGFDPQSPLKLPSDSPSVITSALTSEINTAFVPKVGIASGPSFHPPGSPSDDGFECDYSAMVGWEKCSTPTDRECWLRRKSDGKQFDIFTDYENEAPVGVTRYYNLTLEPGKYDADGLEFNAAKLFNGSYPGPWIEACWGDTLVVNVTNKLAHNGTSIHWHGIRQNQTMHMDGVNGVTQCPIAPQDYFVYKFNITQYGSSWYHSHYSVQYADGAVGPMTLHGPTSAEYDEAISPPLIMTDWGHSSAFVALYKRLQDKDILLNGHGSIVNFNNTAQNTSVIQAPYHITFQPPQEGKRVKKYLLRIINTSFDTTFIFSIDNHRLQMVSTDFVPIHPYSNTSVLVGIGQRYNVIVEALPLAYGKDGQLPIDGNYWIRTWASPCNGNQGGSPGYEKTGILRYNQSSIANPSTGSWKNVSTTCSDEEFYKLHPILPWKVGNPVNSVNNDNFDLWVNGSVVPKAYPLAAWTLTADTHADFTPMRVNYSEPTFLHLDQKGEWDKQWRIVPEDYTSKDWIYLVIKGQKREGGKNWGAHPIHLHGHDFALLEQAYNKNFSISDMNLRLDNPPRRDVVLMPSGGYVVIAFKADNPGAWLVHCHIAFHISEGLGLQIMEHQGRAEEIWPKDDSAIIEAERVCHNWDNWYNNHTNWAVKPEIDCKNTTDPAQCFQDDSGV